MGRGTRHRVLLGIAALLVAGAIVWVAATPWPQPARRAAVAIVPTAMGRWRMGGVLSR